MTTAPRAASRDRLRRSVGLLALLLCLSVGAGAARAEKYRFLVFDARGDRAAGVTDRQAFSLQQNFEVVLQRVAKIVAYSSESPSVQAVFFGGAITKDEMDYLAAGVAMNPSLALRLVTALSWDPKFQYDGALWTVATQVTPPGADAPVDAMQVNIVDRVSKLYHVRVIDDSNKDMAGLASVYAVEAIKGLREKGKDYPEAQLIEAPASPPDGGTTPPPDGGTTTPEGGTTPPPDGGTTTPEGGTTPPPDGGTTTPEGGVTPPAAITPEEANLRLGRAAEVENEGDFQGAIDLREPLIGLPGLTPGALWEAASGVAMCKRKLGDLDGAQKAWEVARSYARTPEDQNMVDMALEQIRGAVSIDYRKVDEYRLMSIVEIRDWLLQRPRDHAGRVALAEKYMEQQPEPDWTRAYEQLETVWLEHPWDARVLTDMCRCLIAKGLAPRAVELLDGWRLRRADTFSDDALRLLIAAHLAARPGDSGFAPVSELLLARKEPLTLTEADMPAFADCIRLHIYAIADGITPLLSDTTHTVKGTGSVERSRTELREAVSAASVATQQFAQALDAVAPPERWQEWHGGLVLSILNFDQALAEGKCALDLNSKDACDRARDYHNLACDQGSRAIEARPSAVAKPAEPPAGSGTVAPSGGGGTIELGPL